jgi:hypothetical protein
MYEPCEAWGSRSIVVVDSSFLLITPRRIVNIPMFRRHCCPKLIKLFSSWHDVTSQLIWIWSFLLFLSLALQAKSGFGHLIVEVCRSHTIRHACSLSRASLNEWPARRRGRYLHNTQQHKRRKTVPLAHSNPRSQQSSTLWYTLLDSTATGFANSPVY